MMAGKAELTAPSRAALHRPPPARGHPVMFVIITGTFFMQRFVPGGPFTAEKAVTPEVLRNLEAYYHLNDPLWKQYADYLWDLCPKKFHPAGARRAAWISRRPSGSISGPPSSTRTAPSTRSSPTSCRSRSSWAAGRSWSRWASACRSASWRRSGATPGSTTCARPWP